MKILKYVLIVITLIVVIFLALGFFVSDVTYDRDITVDKPLAEAWAVSQDESKMSEWLEGFQRVEHVRGTPGTVGAEQDVYFLSEGQEMVIRETITDIQPNESISMNFSSDFMEMDYKLSMEDVGGKTKISTNTVAKGNGMISRSMMALMGGSIKSQEEKNLDLLKKTIESNTTNYFPEPEPMPEAMTEEAAEQD